MSAKVFNPDTLPALAGYNHGVELSGSRILFIAGQTGLSADGTVPAAFAEQFGVALANVRAVLEAAGGTAEDIGRLTIYVTDMTEYLAARRKLKDAYRKHFGRHYPAMSAVEVKGLLFPEMKVEIEATAVLGAKRPS